MHGSEILLFRAVRVEVVQFPTLGVTSHKFPLAEPNGAIALMLPKDRRGMRARLALKNRKQGFAFQRLDGAAFVSIRMFRSGNIHIRRHDVSNVRDAARN